MTTPIESVLENERLFDRREYDQLGEFGLFANERVELVYGRILKMSPKGPEHEWSIQRLTKLLIDRLGDRADVRVQLAFAASDLSEPEPDVAVVPAADYSKAHPSQALLVIEVARRSLKQDRGVKARLYAESGVPEYWVVNLVDQLIEVHSDIVSGAYARITPYRKGERVALLSFTDVVLAAEEVLP